MLKASFTLPNGTIVAVEGSPDEVKGLLDYYSSGATIHPRKAPLPKTPKSENRKAPPPAAEATPDKLAQIVNLIKTCPEADSIEQNILSKSNEANRAILPLYIIHQHLDNAFGLTTIEISKVTAELGPKVRIKRQNVLRALARSSASKYVLSDTTSKVGTASRYTLNDRGVKHIKLVLAGEPKQKR